MSLGYLVTDGSRMTIRYNGKVGIGYRYRSDSMARLALVTNVELIQWWGWHCFPMVSFSIKSGSKIGKCQLKIGKIWVKISRYWYNTYTIQWLSWHRIPMVSANFTSVSYRPWVPYKIWVTEYPKLKNDLFCKIKIINIFFTRSKLFF